MFPSDMRLSDVLRLSMKKSAFDKTPYIFLPQGALDSIITEATILIAMGVTKPTPEDCELAAYILTKAKRLFGTAAYVELRPKTLYKAMVLLRNTNFTDERLPLEEMTEENLLRDVMNGRKHPLVNLEGHVKSCAERIWTFRLLSQRKHRATHAKDDSVEQLASGAKAHHRTLDVHSNEDAEISWLTSIGLIITPFEVPRCHQFCSALMQSETDLGPPLYSISGARRDRLNQSRQYPRPSLQQPY